MQADGKILVGGNFTDASADRRATASPGSMPRPAWLIRSTRTRTMLSIQSRCRRTARFWRAAFSRASADRRATTSPGSMPRPAWLIRSTRTRTMYWSMSIAVQADGKILAGGSFTQHRRTARATASPGSMPRPAWLIRSTRTRTVHVYSIAVQADGKILAGGSFTQHRRTDAQPHRPARCHDRLG